MRMDQMVTKVQLVQTYLSDLFLLGTEEVEEDLVRLLVLLQQQEEVVEEEQVQRVQMVVHQEVPEVFLLVLLLLQVQTDLLEVEEELVHQLEVALCTVEEVEEEQTTTVLLLVRREVLLIVEEAEEEAEEELPLQTLVRLEVPEVNHLEQQTLEVEVLRVQLTMLVQLARMLVQT